MFQKIARDDDIFQSPLFLKDEIAFSIMTSILGNAKKYPSPRVYSNSLDCAIVNSDPQHQVVVWTADSFRKYDKLYDFLRDKFKENKPLRIMSKKTFYDYCVENHGSPQQNIQTLGVYSCQALKDVAYIGRPDQAKPEEIPQVAQMLADFGKETKEHPDAKVADYMEMAQEFVSDPTSLVWRNQNGDIVSIAVARTNEKHPRISRVYTKEKERGHSYAKMLVHYLTSQILKSGKTPMLFTDYSYKSSNLCYQAIGYELDCTIVNFYPPLHGKKEIEKMLVQVQQTR